MIKIINASAGTGKTHYLINLIFKDENGKERDKEQIKEFLRKTVILSFSNAAVDELKRRIFSETIKKFNIEFKNVKDVKDNINKIPESRVYTIHSFILEFAKVLKYDLGIKGDIELELNEDYSIWSKSCEKAFRNDEIYKKKQEILEKIDDDKKRKNVENFIVKKGKILFLISNGFKIEQIKNEKQVDYYDELNERYEKIFNLCKEIGERYYLPEMYEKGIFEFEPLLKIICDFLLRMRQSFGDIEKYRNWFKERLKRENFDFENLFVDEAQDNDIMQNFFIYSVIPSDINKIIVGDPKQSIYYFRNAVPAQFKKAFDEIRAIRTEEEIEEFVLRKSNRIISKKTLDYINEVCSNIKNKLPFIWDYDEQIDALASKNFADDQEEIKFNNLDSKIEIHSIENMGKTLKNLPEIDEFLSDENKKIGILVRNRKYLINTRIIEKIKKINLNEKLKYKLSFELKDELPDYYNNLLKALIEFTNRRNLKKTVMYIYFSNKDSNKFLLHYFLSKEIKEIDLISLLKELKYKINGIVQKYEKKGIALSLLEIFDGDLKNNIWKYYCKDSDDIEFKDLVRIINYVISKIWIEEVEYGSFDAEDAIEILDEINVPFQWFSVQEMFGENADGTGVIEVTTIHSSKGKTYDKVIVIDNFVEELKEKPNFSPNADGSYFKNMFTIKFEKVIDDVPVIKVGLFPYTELDTAKEIRDNDSKGNEWLKEIYENIKKDVISQKLNLLYVALTRTKKDILLLGQFISNNEKNNESVYNVFNIYPYIKEIKNYSVNKADISSKEEFVILKSNKDLMNLTEQFKIYYLRDKIRIKITDRTDSVFERIKRNKINILVHHILYNVFKEIKSEKEFEKLVEKYGEELREIDSGIFEKLKNIKIEIYNLENKKIRTETHLLERNSEGGLKASVELLIYDDKDNLYLTEIKTQFDKKDEEQLKKYANEQLNYYKAMIGKTAKHKNIKINLLTVDLI